MASSNYASSPGSSQNMSSGDLKSQLLSTMKRNGVLGNLKAQLRTQFLSELKALANTEGRRGPLETQLRSNDGQDLKTRVMNTLFAEHLKSMGYRYSLSIFLPESGMNTAPPLSRRDVLSTLNICRGHALYSGLTDPPARAGEGPSLLAEIMTSLETRASSHDAVCQTDGGNTPSERLLQRLGEVDHKFAQLQRQEPRSNVEERLVSFQKRCDENAKKEISSEIERIRSVEIERMKMEERAKYRAMLDSEMHRLQEEHSAQLKAVTDRKNFIEDSLTRQKLEVERTAFDHRQRMLKEIELHRLREEETKRSREVDQRSLEVEKQRLVDLEREFQQQRSRFEQDRLSWTRRCEEDLAAFKADIKRQYLNRENDLAVKENNLKQEKAAFVEEQANGRVLIAEAEGNQNELKSLREQVGAVSQKATSLAMELATAQDHLRIVGDSAKGDREGHRKASDLNDELRAQVSKLQNDLVESRNEAHKRATEQENLIRALGERLADEKTRGASMVREHSDEIRALRAEPDKQISGFKEKVKWMNEEMKQQQQFAENRTRTFENEISSLRQKLEEAETTLSIRSAETAGLTTMLNSARSALDAQLKDNEKKSEMAGSRSLTGKTGSGRDTDALLASLRRRRAMAPAREDLPPQTQQPPPGYGYPAAPMGWPMQMYPPAPPNMAGAWAQQQQLASVAAQAAQNTASAQDVSSSVDESIKVSAPPNKASELSKEKQKLQEELEKEREYQRKELELLKAEHALKLKEQALAAQQAKVSQDAAAAMLVAQKKKITDFKAQVAAQEATNMQRLMQSPVLSKTVSPNAGPTKAASRSPLNSSGRSPASNRSVTSPMAGSPTQDHRTGTPQKTPQPANQPFVFSAGSSGKASVSSRTGTPEVSAEEKARRESAEKDERRRRMQEKIEAEKLALKEKREARENARIKAENERMEAERARIVEQERAEQERKEAEAKRRAGMEAKKRKEEEEEQKRGDEASAVERAKKLEEEERLRKEREAEELKRAEEERKRKEEQSAGFAVIQKKREEVKKRKEEAEARRSRDEAIKKQSEAIPSPVQGSNDSSYGDDSWGSLPLEQSGEAGNSKVDNLSAITGMEDDEIDEDLEVHEVESDSGEDFFI